MEYLRVTVGAFCVNCYLVYNDEKEAVLIDPGAAPARIEKYIEKYGLKPVAIFLTHGHFDHIGAVDYFRDKYGIKAYISEDEYEVAKDISLNSSLTLGGEAVSLMCDETFTDGEVLPVMDGAFKAILTPGHTKGGACFYAESMDRVFSGDTLFLHTVGRYDLPTGDGEVLRKSLKEKLFTLPGSTRVSPGHGLETSIQSEIDYGTDEFF